MIGVKQSQTRRATYIIVSRQPLATEITSHFPGEYKEPQQKHLPRLYLNPQNYLPHDRERANYVWKCIRKA